MRKVYGDFAETMTCAIYEHAT